MTDKKAYLEDIDQRLATKEIWHGLNKMYSQMSHLMMYKYNLLIYRLVRNGYVKQEDLERATGLTRQRIYQIVKNFEEKEIERANA